MYLAERFVEGGFEIYAAALESDAGGSFHAAVVVKQKQGLQAPSHEVFRSERLDTMADGLQPWDALVIALSAGLVVAHQRREALADGDENLAIEPWTGT